MLTIAFSILFALLAYSLLGVAGAFKDGPTDPPHIFVFGLGIPIALACFVIGIAR